MADPKPPDCLMFKFLDDDPNKPPMFRTPTADKIRYWQWCGWFLLADEREIRRADLDDVRKSDEQRGKRE